MNTRIDPSAKQKEKKQIPGDNPIRQIEQDLLQRAEIAEKFARRVCRLDASEGSVVGVFGPWGSGKTSFMNLARKGFEDEEVPVLDFNPWLFSGAEQLVERFISELSAELKLKDLGNIGDAFLEYGDAFSGRIGMLAKIFGTFFRRRESGIRNKRQKVASALREQKKPIIVVLDDVDRLSAPEIQEIFKLVRLTASFPNLIYIVCCDQIRVEQALGEESANLSGRDYLEKIIQLPFKLPEVPRYLLAGELHKIIEDALTFVDEPGTINKQGWPYIIEEIVRPLVRNIRDVKRYAISIRHTLEELDGQVATNDVLALEAVRIFLPDMFKLLPQSINALTIPGWFVFEQHERLVMRHESEPMAQIHKMIKHHVDEIIESPDPKNQNIAKAVIDFLFPVGEYLWEASLDNSFVPDTERENERLILRRVAHEHVFRLYLERVISPDLRGNHHAEHVISLMANRKGLREFIDSLKPAEWHGLVSNLNLSGRKFQNEHLETLVIVLLEHWSKMPNGMTDWILLDRARSNVRKIIGQILSAIEDSDIADAMVGRILNELNSLSSRLILVELLKRREKPYTDIVSESVLQEHENMLMNEIDHAPNDVLAGECDLMRVLYYAKGRVSGRPYHTDRSVNELTIIVLLSSLREKRGSVFLDGLPVHVLPKLDCDGLVKLYGNPEHLKQRIDDLKAKIYELNPLIKRRIPFEDFKAILALAEDCLNQDQPGNTDTSN